MTIKTIFAAACVTGATCIVAPLPAAALDAMAEHAQHMALLGAPIPKPDLPPQSAPEDAGKTSSKAVRLQPRGQSAAGDLVKQTATVQTNCFTAPLRTVLADMQAHFGRPVIVTSGFRSHAHNRRAGGAKRSLHTACMAADVQLSGVSPSAVARWARSHPGVGGVGSYRRTRSVHVDVGVRIASWGGGSRG